MLAGEAHFHESSSLERDSYNSWQLFKAPLESDARNVAVPCLNHVACDQAYRAVLRCSGRLNSLQSVLLQFSAPGSHVTGNLGQNARRTAFSCTQCCRPINVTLPDYSYPQVPRSRCRWALNSANLCAVFCQAKYKDRRRKATKFTGICQSLLFTGSGRPMLSRMRDERPSHIRHTIGRSMLPHQAIFIRKCPGPVVGRS